MKIDDIYPLTIITDRYNGAYSGGQFLAFGLDHWDIPDEIGSSGLHELNFWDDQENSLYVGKGNTIIEACNNLMEKLNREA